PKLRRPSRERKAPICAPRWRLPRRYRGASDRRSRCLVPGAPLPSRAARRSARNTVGSRVPWRSSRSRSPAARPAGYRGREQRGMGREREYTGACKRGKLTRKEKRSVGGPRGLVGIAVMPERPRQIAQRAGADVLAVAESEFAVLLSPIERGGKFEVAA